MKVLKEKNLKTIFAIAAVVAFAACGIAFADADFTFYEINPNKQIRLVNPIYLDSSKVSHPSLKVTNPSENGLSSLSTKSSKTQQVKFNDPYSPITETAPFRMPTPSEYNAGKQDVRQAENSIIPSSNVNAFAPPIEEVQQEIQDETLPPMPTFVQIPQDETPKVEQNNESSYFASVQEEDINYDGKTVSGITIKGLNQVSEDAVLNRLSIRNGSKYNAEKLQEDLQNIYNMGYFSDNMSITPTLNDNDTVSLEYTLQENIIVSDVSIKGNTVFKTHELLPIVKPLKGQPQNLNNINDAIERLNKYYADKGYILASVKNVDDTEDGALIFEISEGIIEQIVFEGNHKTKNYVIERNILTQPGTIYNEEYIKKDIAKLYSTQIFKEVDRKIEPSPNKDGEYIVTVKVTEDSSNSLSIGGGIDNALGAFGSIGYNEKNFLGKGQKFGISGMIGSGVLLSDASIKNRMNYNLEMNWMEPHFMNENTSLAAKLFYRDLGSYQIPLAIERRFGISTRLEHKIKGNEHLTTNFGIGFEHIHLSEGDKDKIANMYKRNNINFAKRKEQLRGGSFLNISPGVKYSTLDNEDMPREGLIAKANFVEALGIDDIHHSNGRLIGGITKYIPVFKKSTLSIGAKGGVKVHGKEMPEVMAFRLGGPYSVRGFKMNGVGTGEHFIMGSAELQTPIPFFDRFKYDILKNMRFAFFVDAGKVFDPTVSSKLYDRPLSAISGGIGLRIYIPNIGPISIDYGIPITNPGHYGKRSGQFTFGTSGYYDSYY